MKIEICLGSSCFARGAPQYPSVIAEVLTARGVSAEVVGRRCRELCAKGPTVVIDGAVQGVPDADTLRRLVHRALDARAPTPCVGE